jgi:NAD(P)-dependent dehydrogenase (short-subunit alcohol dehydrogenase family)
MGRLDGKRALVIGAARGMGAATARMMAREGATVIVADIVADGAEQVAVDIRSTGATAHAIAVDISSEASIEALIEQAAALVGTIDVLHNNAAALEDPVSAPDVVSPVFDIPTEAWDRTMAVNLRGVWLACKYAVPRLRRVFSLERGGEHAHAGDRNPLRPLRDPRQRHQSRHDPHKAPHR